MNKLLATLGLLAALVLTAAPAHATGRTFYLSASAGDDDNTCTIGDKCKTFRRVCDEIGEGTGIATIIVADGVYTRDPLDTASPFICSLTYGNTVTVVGNVAAPWNVELLLLGNDTGFFIQDGAIAGINGVYIHSSGSGSIGIKTRQNAIGDYANVWFGTLYADVAATEGSKINCLSGVVMGNAIYQSIATAYSQVGLSCPLQFVAGVTFTAVVLNSDSLVDVSSPSFSRYGGGTLSVSGLKYDNDHGRIRGATNLPGSGVFNHGNYEVNQ